MTLLDHLLPLDGSVVRHGVAWDEYECLLEQIGDRPLRVTYCNGRMEIMSPLPEHEAIKEAISDLIKELCRERSIPRLSFGSTTFRNAGRIVGAEPDACFYLRDLDVVRGMKRFDPAVHPAPTLWIEVDIFSQSRAREPAHAGLAVPEIWRHNGKRLEVRLLSSAGTYIDSSSSRAFPFLPIPMFSTYISRMLTEDANQVLDDFSAWLKVLPR